MKFNKYDVSQKWYNQTPIFYLNRLNLVILIGRSFHTRTVIL